MNQNSFLLLGLIIVVLGSALFVRVNMPVNRILILVGIVTMLFFIGVSLRTGNSSISSTDDIKGILARGEPSVLMFYSNY